MNKPIRTMSLFCLLLFAALLLNATYLQYVDAGHLNDRSDNRRVLNAEFSRKRGAIVAGGAAVAESRRTNDQYTYQRVYRQPLSYAPITGFFSYIYGTSGVERSENDVLSGSDPRLFVNRVVDILGNNQPAGGSVSLTINTKAQRAAFEGMRRLGAHTQGAVVALQPSTGKVLAMVTNPTYNPNRLASHDFSAVTRAWKQLTGERDEPLLNRAIGSTLPPGSTFKLVTAAAALSSGQYTPSTQVKGGTSLDLPDTTTNLTNENGSDCGGDPITLTQALEVSCNVSFGDIGLRLGAKKLRRQAERFGFDQTYLNDLPNQAQSRFPAHPDEPQTALSAIGQYDVAATPLQMAMVAAGIANGGTVMRPYVVDEVRAPDLSVLDKTRPEAYRTHAVSASVARQLTQMMVAVVNEGTGTTAQIPGVQVAGKTGTAQSAPSRPPYAWFVSFAPAQNPKVAVAVLVEDAGVERDAISGSGLAAPIAKDVMEAVINP